MPDLTAQTRNGAGDVVLTLRGEIDLATGQDVEHALLRGLEEAQRRLVVDLRELSFVDSTGLAILLRLDREARAAGRTLVVIRGQPQVHRVFELTGATDLLTIVDRLDSEGG